MDEIPGIGSTAILIQARSTSTRLPRKCFLPLPAPSGPPLLEWVHSRMASTGLPVILLVPESDRPIRTFCESHGWDVLTGPEDDVRERFRRAARHMGLSTIVRATGDNPLLDPVNVRLCLERFAALGCDLFSLSGLPLGFGVEVFRSAALLRDVEPIEPMHREHVSLHIKHFPEQFRVAHEVDPRIQAMPPALASAVGNLRLTVDEEKDYETLCGVLDALIETNEIHRVMGATLEDVMDLFSRRPEIFLRNADVEQRRFQRNG